MPTDKQKCDMETNRSFGVHLYTFSCHNIGFLVHNLWILDRNDLLWHLPIHHFDFNLLGFFYFIFLTVAVFLCCLMYFMVLKCNCTVSRKECNKLEFCIVYTCNYLCFFYHLYHINALYSVFFFSSFSFEIILYFIFINWLWIKYSFRMQIEWCDGCLFIVLRSRHIFYNRRII